MDGNFGSMDGGENSEESIIGQRIDSNNKKLSEELAALKGDVSSFYRQLEALGEQITILTSGQKFIKRFEDVISKDTSIDYEYNYIKITTPATRYSPFAQALISGLDLATKDDLRNSLESLSLKIELLDRLLSDPNLALSERVKNFKLE